MKYPFSPDILDAMPEELAELFRGLEITLLADIANRLKATEQLTASAVQDIRVLRSHGIDLEDIKKAIKKTTGLSERQLDALLDDVVARNQSYYTELIDIAQVTAPATLVSAAEIDAIRRQTMDTFRNITQSMGFLVDAGRTMLEPAKAYQWALDNAAIQVQSGAISYNQAIANATRQLTDSGLKVVDYESGRHDQIDVAVRRAVLSSIGSINQQYAIQSMEYLDTDLVEVSAHAGARNIGDGFENHEDWQGKIYRWKKNDRKKTEEPATREDAKSPDIQFSEKMNSPEWAEPKRIITDLAEEYNTKLKTVNVGARQAAGTTQISGTVMNLSSKSNNVAIHEFAHTLSMESQTKLGLSNDAAFWKEIKSVQRQYKTAVEGYPEKWISSYEHAQRGADEFMAEAFTQAKMAQMGLPIPAKYGTDFTYSNKVLQIIDKYYKKQRR